MDDGGGAESAMAVWVVRDMLWRRYIKKASGWVAVLDINGAMVGV